MADYARDLVGLLDPLGVGRATIVGLSIGGLIAQELYRQRPERVAALVLCDTAAKIGTDEVWDQRIAAGRARRRRSRWPMPSWSDGSPPISDAARSAELAGMRAMLTRTPRQGYLAACGALKRADLRPYAGRIGRRPCAWSATRTAPRPSLWLGKRRSSSPVRALKSLKAQGICQTSRSRKSLRNWSPNTLDEPPLEALAGAAPARRESVTG